MIIYDLVCSNHHGFEGWFKNSNDYQAQQEAELVRCPACDSDKVNRKPSKIKIASSKTSAEAPIVDDKEQANANTGQTEADSASAMHFTSTAEQLESVRTFIEKNFEDVGEDLSAEVRKMHYGETEQRGIRGTASEDEVADLAEEGIDLYSIPIGSKNKKDLN